MEDQWKIYLYRTPQGDSPVKEFINSLELTTQTKVRTTISLLKNFGIVSNSPHIKKLTGTKLWELRILGSDSVRILYIAIPSKTFLLLHGFKKKSQRTPPKEIRTAEERLAEHITRIR